jgi:hypothetical protein
MNHLKNITIMMAFLMIAFSCKKEVDNLKELENISPPSNVSAVFDITQDNTGLVTIKPSGEGVTSYLITFGDVANETPTEYDYNEVITHIYTEGVFKIGITAVGLSGLTSFYEEDLNVTFKAPENLIVTIEPDAVNPRLINVSATADFATIMDFYFGDVENEEPVHALPGEVVSHTYEEAGDFVLTVEAKSGGEATTIYNETITIAEATDPVNLPVTFESFAVNYAFVDFGNAESSVIDNPDATGINTSNRVGKTLKAVGAETWAGSFLTMENPIDFSTTKLFKVKVWTPASGAIVKLKVENLDNGDISYEVDAVTTTSNQWEELSFDYSGIDVSNEYQKVVIFFDFGNMGDGSIYYFDDIKLVGGNPPPALMVENFEGVAPEFTEFGNIAAIEVLANPDQSGVNTTANAAKLTKTAGAETWAGAFFEVASPLDLDNFNKINVKTWSPVSGIVVKLKLENSDASIVHEVDLNTTVASAWEDLVFDFSGAPAADYMRIVIFFDFGNVGDDAVYYFDEIELANEGGGGGGDSPLEGTWQIAPEAGSLGVGPNQGDISWWSIDDAGVIQRDCFYDDTYVFGADGSFSNVLGIDTWIEGWQGGSDACGAPVDPHDGFVAATYTYNESTGTVTLNGTGAYLGIPKAFNGGELTNPADAPEFITYEVAFSENNTVMVLDIHIAPGTEEGWWRFKLIKN